MEPLKVDLTDHLVELIRRTSTELPNDVNKALKEAMKKENPDSPAYNVLETILKNVEIAKTNSTPICQDTGTPNFYVYLPFGYSLNAIEAQIKEALRIATKKSYLRPNAVDPLTGKNSGDNTGIDFPTIHFIEWDQNSIKIDLLLKGGGSENVSAQFKLPDKSINAGRDLKGVRNAVLTAIYQAQGKGCAPGVIGVGIGGDRATSHIMAKKQLFRKLDDSNPNPELNNLEKKLLEEANKLEIGPMGFGGKTTVLGVKVGVLHRLPACYFVSVAYMCWACRRHSMIWQNGEVYYD